MNTAGSRRWLRAALRLARVACGAAAVAVLCFLPFAGRYLVVDEPLEHADAIVVLAGARVERWLEAADLYRSGWAPRVVLSPGRIESAELQLRERGVRFPAEVELTRDALVQLGVPLEAIDILPGSLDNTADEARATHAFATTARWHRIIVVTSKYHTRRTSFAFRRAFRAAPIAVVIHASRYDPATPERWWRDRADVRYVTSELQKLLAYRLGLAE